MILRVIAVRSKNDKSLSTKETFKRFYYLFPNCAATFWWKIQLSFLHLEKD